MNQMLGFLRVHRVALALGAAAVSITFVGIHEMPAQAATLQQQAYVAQLQTLSIGTVFAPAVTRDSFGVTSFTVVQWPIAPTSTVSSYFGYRVPPCAGCSSFHRGVDFNPGAGTPIQAIADGVVTEIGNPSGELGVYVVVQHDVDGVTFSSVYGHMQFGSLGLNVGDHVTRGQIVGLVGDTGQSTGPHLHFGILDAAGTPIDPLGWMAAHVTQAWGS